MPQIKGSSSEVKTSFLSRSYVFRWSIENFPKCLATFKLKSQEFKPIKNKSVARIFSVTLEKESGDNCILTINSFPEETDENRFEIKFTITVTDSTGKIFERRDNDKTYLKNYGDSCSFLFSNKNLKENIDSMENKTLIFNCLMEFEEPATTVHQDQLVLSTSPEVKSDLLKGFQTMYLDSPFADLKLLVQDDAIRVHKCVLSARSPVFAKLLVSSMEEMSNDEIIIDDIEIPILKLFILFLYTGTIPAAELEFDNVCGLYYAADKYDVPSLRKWCSNYLVFNMDAENACCLLSLADRHSDDKLRDLVMNYIKFEFEAVLRSESLTEFVKNETELAIEVLKLRGKKIEKKSSSKTIC